MVGSIPHKQGECRECSMCWQKQAVRPEGGLLSLPLLSPVQGLLLNYLQGQIGVGSLCIQESTSWRWDRKFCNLRYNRISPNHSGVRKASFTSSFSKIIIWIHPLLWHQSKVVIDNTLLFGENNRHNQSKEWPFGMNLVWTGTMKAEKQDDDHSSMWNYSSVTAYWQYHCIQTKDWLALKTI